MMFMYNILRNHIDCPNLLASIGFRVPRRPPRQPQGLLYPPISRSNLKYNSPLVRLSRGYNELGQTIDVFNSSRATFRADVLKLLST